MTAQPQFKIPPLAEFRDLLPHLPVLSPELRTTSLEWAQGKIDAAQADLIAQIAHAQQRFPIKLDHPRIAILTGNNPSAWVKSLPNAGHVLPYICQRCDADLRLYEMPGDGAMDETQTAQAIAYGMMIVETGVDVVLALVDDTIVPPASISHDPLVDLQQAGTRTQAALLGLILAARMGKVPVILLGAPARQTAAFWDTHYPSLREHAITLDGDADTIGPLLLHLQAMAAWQLAG